MDRDKITEKRMMYGGIVLIAAIVMLTIPEWNEYVWYEAVSPYGTLISFAALLPAAALFVRPKDAVKDPLFWLAVAASVIAGVNLIVIGSGKGAWLTATDVILVIYLADKVRFSKPLVWFTCVYIGFYFFYWTFDVKGYFKGYNTNYGGLVLITGFVFAVTGMLALREKLRKSDRRAAVFLLCFIIFCFVWSYNIIAWYRARCALLGLAVFFVLSIVPLSVWKNRVFYTLLTIAMTVGAIAVSLIYVWLGRYAKDIDIRIFYKDIISGRDEIWTDLWAAFAKHPLTGIGSSYRINVDWMGGMFEVHNGLLDILIVHGIIVFVITCFMLIIRLLGLRPAAGGSVVARSAMAGVFAILAASFMENFFIVPPFLLCTLALIAIARSV